MENRSKVKNLVGKKIAILGYGVENKALVEWLIKNEAKNITICDQKPQIEFSIFQPKAGQHLVDNFPAKSWSASGRQFSIKSQIQNIKFQTGKDYLEDLDKFDLVFRTPGIPFQTPEIQKAIKSGVEISSQMKLFFDLCPASIIGVTGTKGKGTTTTLIYEILKLSTVNCQMSNVYLGGNIGNPPIEFLDKLTKDDIVVLELSSFQLEDMKKSPHIAVVLDITSDHLDHHLDTKEYVDAKANIIRYQNKDDFTVINLDYMTSFKFAAISPTKNDYYFSSSKSVDLGSFVKGEKIVLRVLHPVILEPNVIRHRESSKILDSRFHGNDRIAEYEVCKIYDIQLVGKHNLENICAAITAAHLAGVSIESIRESVKKYQGLEHRLELVRNYQGVEYYDDSASTNPFTTIAAIKSFEKPIILIAGGSYKGADYSQLGKVIAKSKNIKKVILIGKTAKKIEKAIKQYSPSSRSDKSDHYGAGNIAIEQFGDKFEKAINYAAKIAKPGTVVLLSPACASFDMFINYEERGNEFKKIVRKIR